MKKIIPLKEKTLDESRKTYDELFEDIWYYIADNLKARGKHDLITFLFNNVGYGLEK